MTFAKFIATRIEDAAEESLAKGQEKYRNFFVRTKIYRKWQNEVDAILTKDGHKDVIVAV